MTPLKEFLELIWLQYLRQNLVYLHWKPKLIQDSCHVFQTLQAMSEWRSNARLRNHTPQWITAPSTSDHAANRRMIPLCYRLFVWKCDNIFLPCICPIFSCLLLLCSLMTQGWLIAPFIQSDIVWMSFPHLTSFSWAVLSKDHLKHSNVFYLTFSNLCSVRCCGLFFFLLVHLTVHILSTKISFPLWLLLGILKAV